MADKERDWIGVDLDSSLAYYERGDFKKLGATSIGAPIPLMVNRVKLWLASGRRVKIFTARVATPEPGVVRAIEDWCEEHLGERLEITCVKDGYMTELWDDRAIGLISNTGKVR